jgi:1-acyl-sn-glycerol-3-phosphate acyltransferase
MQGVADCRQKLVAEQEKPGMLEVLLTVWGYALLVLWTLFGILVFPVLFGLALVFLRCPADQLMRRFIWLYGRGWLVFMSPFVRFRRENMALIKPGQPCLLVVNHLSFFDTYCMALLPVHDITFAVRSWPFHMFWYSTFMRLARYLDVEGDSWEQTLSNCRSAFAAGGTVLFFPEGHRSRDGRLQRFYSGGFKAALATGVPVVPLCITGTDRLLPPGRRTLRPCRVTLRALEPIETAQFAGEDGHIRLRKLVKRRMAIALAEMRGEERPAETVLTTEVEDD